MSCPWLWTVVRKRFDKYNVLTLLDWLLQWPEVFHPVPFPPLVAKLAMLPSCPNPPTAFIYPQRKPTQMVIIRPKDKIENKGFIIIVFHSLLMFSLKTVDKLLIEFEAISAARRCNIGVTTLICNLRHSCSPKVPDSWPLMRSKHLLCSTTQR